MLARISSSRATLAGSAAGARPARLRDRPAAAGCCRRAARRPCWPGSARAGTSRPCRASTSAPRACGPRPSWTASSARPIALAYRRSILSRTSSSDGVLPGAASDDIDSSDLATVSCILACSSWLSSLVRSASFCWRIIALFSTAWRACAGRAERLVVQRLEVFHRPARPETSWVARVCAVCSYFAGLGLVAVGPGLVGQHERLPGHAPAASRPRTSAGTASSPAAAGCRSPPRPAAPGPGAGAAPPRSPAGSAPSGRRTRRSSRRRAPSGIASP